LKCKYEAQVFVIENLPPLPQESQSYRGFFASIIIAFKTLTFDAKPMYKCCKVRCGFKEKLFHGSSRSFFRERRATLFLVLGKHPKRRPSF